MALRPSGRLVLVESIPQDLPSIAGSPSAQPLAQAWPQLLDAARETVHVASFYWSLTGPDIGVNDSSSRPVRPGPAHPLRTPGRVSGSEPRVRRVGSWGKIRVLPSRQGGQPSRPAWPRRERPF